ncbi:MAG: hypothetical protein KDI46_05715 [Alphaproteobacteria bacterium]|nr:hypothetical protein [Alphaproteobacteria bacterium]
MVYVAGVFGFIGGFILGQMMLYFLLRHKSREELLNDRFLKWTYGLGNWVVAGFSSYGMVLMYQYYFPPS